MRGKREAAATESRIVAASSPLVAGATDCSATAADGAVRPSQAVASRHGNRHASAKPPFRHAGRPDKDATFMPRLA